MAVNSHGGKNPSGDRPNENLAQWALDFLTYKMHIHSYSDEQILAVREARKDQFASMGEAALAQKLLEELPNDIYWGRH